MSIDVITPQSSRDNIVILEGQDRWQDTLKAINNTTFSQCTTECANTASCVGFVMDNVNPSNCWLKTAVEPYGGNGDRTIVKLFGSIVSQNTQLPSSLADLIRLSYRTFLGREGSAAEVNGWSTGLKRDAQVMTNYQVWKYRLVPAFTASEEFKQKYPNAQYVVTPESPIPTLINTATVAGTPQTQAPATQTSSSTGQAPAPATQVTTQVQPTGSSQPSQPTGSSQPDQADNREQETARKSQSGSKAWIWILIAAIVVVLIVVVVVIVLIRRKRSSSYAVSSGVGGQFSSLATQ